VANGVNSGRSDGFSTAKLRFGLGSGEVVLIDLFDQRRTLQIQ